MAYYGHLVLERLCYGHYVMTALPDDEFRRLFPSIQFVGYGEINSHIESGHYVEPPHADIGFRMYRLIGSCSNLTDEGACSVWGTDMLPPWCNTSNGNPEMM